MVLPLSAPHGIVPSAHQGTCRGLTTVLLVFLYTSQSELRINSRLQIWLKPSGASTQLRNYRATKHQQEPSNQLVRPLLAMSIMIVVEALLRSLSCAYTRV